MCNKCNGNCSSCNCTCNKSCTEPDCACKVFVTTDCVTLTEDLTCSNILKGQTETEVLKQLDTYICDRFETVENFFQLINVGTGSQVYKGISVLGKKELRTLLGSNLIDVTQGTNDITISVDETALSALIYPPLEKINEGNGDGIIIRGRVPGNYGNIGFRAIDLSYSGNISSIAGATGISSFASGDNTRASASYSTATGSDTVASATFSNASNSNTRASGNISHAEGDDTEASGDTSHSEGQNTLASGDISHSQNLNTLASGKAAHAEGEDTTASGETSHAEGFQSRALAKYSHAGGNNNDANAYCETSIGMFGTAPAGNLTTWVGTDRIFSVGNGLNGGALSDAVAILKNGLATLPSVTNALISAASGKAIVTKEYLVSVSPDGSETKVTAGTNVTVTGIGTIPNPFVINATDTNTTYSAGTDISLIGTTFNNTAPDQTVTLTQGGSTTVSGTYPNFTVSSTDTIADGSETKINNGITTTKTGLGTIASPYVIEVENLQKIITYPADFTGTNYTLTDADKEYTIFVNNGTTAVTITLNTSVTASKYCVGFIQEGSADITYVGTGVSLTNPIGLKSKGQGYQTFIERKLSTSTYYLLGNTKV
jgi:hypothetical protein